MKTLEELTTTSEIAELLPKVILEEVEEAARARRFGRNLIQINEDLVRTKGRSIVIGRRATLTAASVAEGSAPNTAVLDYSANTITPSKIGVTVKITQEAIDGANLDLIRDNITEAGIALADKEDADILDILTGKTAGAGAATCNTIAAYGLATFTVTAGLPFLVAPSSITVAGTLVAVQSVDYIDAKVTAYCPIATSAGTVGTHYVSNLTNVRDAITGATLSYEDLVGGLGVIRAAKWTPDFILIHPNQVNDLLKSSAFRDASQYGSPEVLLRGEIGMISGVKILVSTNMPEGTVLYICSKRAAWFALKRPVDMKRWDNPSTDSVELYFYMEYGLAVTDQSAIAISIGHISSHVNL